MYPFDNFDADFMNHLLPGQQALQDQLKGSDSTEVETVSASGACSVATRITELTVSATKAYTLADGPIGTAGFRKIIRCKTAASSPLGTLTITTPDDTAGFVCAASFLFDTAGQEIELEWTGTAWRCIRKQRVGFKTLVVGTTVTTGICNMTHINLSVTGTVASLTTKGIPDGSARGEVLLVGCGTADTTPHGDIAMTVIGTSGTAGTALDDFTALTDHLMFAWSGSAWQLLCNNSAAVAIT
jgi:hypothetical protein